MKLRFRTISLSIHLVWLSMISCQTEPILPEPAIGLIECTDTELIKCWQSSKEDVYVFRSLEEYNQLVKNDSDHPNCVDYKKPFFDFNRESIIYVSKLYTGCDYAEVEQTLKYVGSNRYNFHLEVLQQGSCYGSWSYTKVCRVPRISEDAIIIITENIETAWDHDN